MTKAYVFAASVQEPHVLAGTLEYDGQLGAFTYNDNWLSQPWAYPLDPVNLPLSPKTYRVSNNKGVHGVFSDAGPDDWGTRILLMHHTHLPTNELERLLRTSGNGVGCLAFSLSRTRPLIPKPLPLLGRIQELVKIVNRAESNQSLSAEELALIDPGSSMGGARPKISCIDEQGKKWLIKFSRKGDLIDTPRLEFASMRFLKDHLRLNVPECQLLDLGNGVSAFMIERFDEGCHFISAHSLFNQEKIRLIQDSKRNPYSYVSLASILRKHATDFERDCTELFRRMIVNILLGNTDDHARNHAMIFNIHTNTWSLSPTYDVLPSINGTLGKQALGVGTEGATSSIENALSYSQLFGIKQDKAQGIADEMKNILATRWREQLEASGLAGQEVELVLRYQQIK